ncbi:YaeQ family protein [Marinobacterium arenosum]|uniref:YaeQ family protein n=1 Tax=Marinobacterium arenosum TaxID=2862496 RepID=UPI001C953B6A|nr:YaeQ family protein [Marinobacterium arenosum]MBY4675804.1 YaeQ family protein [Marinobacterium arenosum]
MALKPTIYKIDLNLADMDRHVYETLRLTVAQHPSETLQRMMVRVLVYALNYDAELSFTKGLSSQDEPDLWHCTADGRIAQWIELGQATPERMRKAISRAEQVLLYAYGSETDIWWQKNRQSLGSLPKLSVKRFDWLQVEQLDRFVSRTMALSISISDGELYLSGDADPLSLTLESLQ